MSKYVAYLAPYAQETTGKPPNDLFESEEGAWEYIKEQLCPACKKELLDGYTMEFGKKMYITHPAHTACGAEWFVLKQEEYEKCSTFRDILAVAGFSNFLT